MLSFTACIERASSIYVLPSLIVFLAWKGTHVGLRAAVERGPSQDARSGSTGPTWVSSIPFIVRALRARRTAGCSRSPSLLFSLSPITHLVLVSAVIPTAAVERPLSEMGVPGAKESPH